ncbi:MAG: type IV pilin-like G/H family protein [Cyanobacteria bacterium P01_G01_bin.39]
MKKKLLLIPIGLMSFIVPIKIISSIFDYSNQSNVASFPQESQRQTQQRESFNQKIVLNLGGLNRAQQANFFELNKFANSYEELSQQGIGLPEAKENYELIIENKGDSAFSYAVPRNSHAAYKEWSGSAWVEALEPLHSYVGGIAYSKNGFFTAIICASTIPGKQKLEEPKIIGDKLVCSDDSQEIL